jgi:hypothetical protein
MKYLFVSYSQRDAEIAQRVSSKLESAGYVVWIEPSESRSEEKLSSETVFSIERSDGLLLALSPNAIDSVRVSKELALAFKAQTPITVAILQPVTIPAAMRRLLVDSQSVDLSIRFDEEFDRLLEVLKGGQSVGGGELLQTESAGIDGYAEIPSLPDEKVIWSEDGYYWYKKWRSLTRVKVLATTLRLIFIWDTRDMWKWKAREEKELSATFPISILLSNIESVGQIQKPKTLLIFPSSTPYVEITTRDNSLHKITLQQNFERRVKYLRELIAENGILPSDSGQDLMI